MKVSCNARAFQITGLTTRSHRWRTGRGWRRRRPHLRRSIWATTRSPSSLRVFSPTEVAFRRCKSFFFTFSGRFSNWNVPGSSKRGIFELCSAVNSISCDAQLKLRFTLCFLGTKFSAAHVSPNYRFTNCICCFSTHRNLSNNRIHTLDKGCLYNLTALVDFKLNRNRISTIPKELFKRLSALRSL